MNKPKTKYSHLVEVDEDASRIYIFRLDVKSGKKHLLTYVDLPKKKYDEDPEAFKEFARIFGENILLDSAVIRKILGL